MDTAFWFPSTLPPLQTGRDEVGQRSRPGSTGSEREPSQFQAQLVRNGQVRIPRNDQVLVNYTGAG